MYAVRASILYDGSGKAPKKNVYVHFDSKIRGIAREKKRSEVIAEGVVTPAFIDAHCHIGMYRSGEPDYEGEGNDKMESVYPLADALESVYMDDRAFKESIEHGVLYSVVLPGSGNIVGGRGALIRNFGRNVREAYIKHIGIKTALGYNPRSTTEWKGRRPTTRMGAVAILKENLIRAKKARVLLRRRKKVREEIDPITEIFMDVIEGKERLMVHVHKEDDIAVLIKIVEEFGINAIVNHACDVHTREGFEMIKSAGLPIIYGPVDAFAYKVELKHESWRNIKHIIDVRPDFCLMSDHPVVLQRNLYLQLRFFVRLGMKKEEAISLITGKSANIIGADNMGTIARGKAASLIVWSGDPFSFDSYPIMVIGEGKILHEES